MHVTIVGTDYPDFERHCPHWNGIQAGLKRLEIDYTFVSCRGNNDWVAQVVESRADVVVYGLIDVIHDARARRVIRTELPHATIVLWFCDIATKPPRLDCSSTIDAMFLTNDGQAGLYRRQFNLEASYLPQGSEPLDHPIIDARFELPFVFVGKNSRRTATIAARSELISLLERRHRLVTINGQGSTDRAEVFRLVPTIYGSAKVTLDLSRRWDIPGYCSNRYFNVPAAFGFSLTQRFPGCEELYPSGVGKVYFTNLDEAISLKEEYLANELARKEVIRRGHEHSYQHTYDRRFRTMFARLRI